MATFLMFGKYSMESVGKISSKRTKKANSMVGDLGGKIKAEYVLLGETDLVLVVEFPGTKEAMKASVELSKLLQVSFTTSPALSAKEFDKLIEGS